MNANTKSHPVSVVHYADDPHLDRGTKAFLKILNSSGAPPLESLSPREAQQGLVEAQTSVEVDLSGIEVTQKTITSEGYMVDLHLVRPAGVRKTLPVFMFIHLFLIVLLFMALSGGNVSQAQSIRSKVKNIVLVHGAFADGSSWSKVITLL
jgi:hypothetical protein